MVPADPQPLAAQPGLFDADPSTAGAVSRHPRASRELELGGLRVAYEFERGQRRSIGLRVGPQGLSVRAPRWTPLAEVEALLRRKADWVLAKLRAAAQAERLAPAALDWREGMELPYLGRRLTLVLAPGHGFEGAGAALSGERLLLALASDAGPERVRDAAQAWLMQQARRVFVERLDHYAPRLEVRYRSLRLSSAATRWGSASADGAIRLNWRLIHLSLEMIDYVVAHELSHLREMNHGSGFWGVVESVMPDYEARREALRRVRLARD